MDGAREPGAGPRPVFGGCFGIIAGGVILLAAMVFFVVFLNSGANTGKLILRDAASYRDGTVEFVGERNFYVVRLANGEFLALSDLDAANRATPGHRCRVAPLGISDRRLPDLLERYGTSMSPDARGATLLFHEDCNGAVYDLTGLRLDAEGPNLERYATTIDDQGRLIVDVSRRICTQASDGAFFAETRC